jgi:hypothetical protein
MVSRFSYMEGAEAVNLIEVLAEIFNICSPSLDSLKAEISGDMKAYKTILMKSTPPKEKSNETENQNQ